MKEKNRKIGKYEIMAKIGEGSFGKVYHVRNVTNNELYALKLETDRDTDYRQIKNEYEIYKALRNLRGISEVYDYGEHNGSYYLVMDCYEKNLQKVFEENGNRFSVETTSKLAIVLIKIFKEIHGRKIILRDFKPENVLISNEKVYLVDFGMAKYYINKETGQHIPFITNKKLTGTVRYASLYTHLGYEQSRRDDLETLLYTLIFFLKGTLPWVGIKSSQVKKKFQKIADKKESISAKELCKDIPCGENIEKALIYVKNLGFDEDPDYEKLINYFNLTLKEIGTKNTEINFKLEEISNPIVQKKNWFRRFITGIKGCFS